MIENTNNEKINTTSSPKQEASGSIKRSALKMANHFDQKDIIQYQKNSKRNSVSWNVSSPFGFKQLKTTFDKIEEPKKCQTMKNNKEFEEKRRQSIKNEFALARELLKNSKETIEELDEANEEVQENTWKNKDVGKEDNIQSESDSHSHESEDEK